MDLQNFRFPPLFARLGSRIPTPLSHVPLMLLLEIARRRDYLVAPEALYGKQFSLTVEDLGLRFHFICEQGKFKSLPASSPADIALSACAIDFFQLASGQEDADTLFFRRRLKMEGDTELGIAVKYWIDASERPAWLTQLSQKLPMNA